MKLTVFIISLLLVIISCNQEQGNSEIKPNVIDSSFIIKDIDSLKIKTAELDSIPIHIFKSGETLEMLSKKYYGNRKYSTIMALYNKIDNVNAIKPDTHIKIPDFSYLLHDSSLGLYPIIGVEMDKVLKARELFMTHEKELYNLRNKDNPREKIILPVETKADIKLAAKLINESITLLKIAKSDNLTIPEKMISHLKYVARNLENLSKGNNDGRYGYDLDMVHQMLALAIVDAINNYTRLSQNLSK